MRWHEHPDQSWPRLRRVGRIAAALVAGGAFAVLSYDPRPATRETEGLGKAQSPGDSNATNSAERQGAVKEDGASPQLMVQASWVDREELWGLTQARLRVKPWPDGSMQEGITSEDVARDVVPASQHEAMSAGTTTVPHSRGPP